MSYTSAYFEDVHHFSMKSAERIVPAVMELVAPSSVVDIGCGSGDWLSVFRANGVNKILGVDQLWGDRRDLQIPAECFQNVNLDAQYEISGSYDLAMSVEVGEHLQPEAGSRLVKTLCGLAPVVLFSAAVPGQGGEHHVNEQWPDYWAAKFAAEGFTPVDCLRQRFWKDEAVSWWYSQNLIIYVRADRLASYPKLKAAAGSFSALPVVHPRMLSERMDPARLNLGSVLKALPGMFRNAIAWRLDIRRRDRAKVKKA